MTSRYEHLLALARRERELVDASRWDDLAALGADWEALTADLPDASAEESGLLEEIAVTVWSTIAAVQAALDQTTHLLDHIQRGRQAIGSYAGNAPGAALDARV